ncbi:MAG: Adenosylcobinamide-GDP ribazoletransferase [Gammaproteobacteria bacterium]|nr:Adenosylcobinamide-GDP ribazoletransferase [Gammaproteobacteria bacterium]
MSLRGLKLATQFLTRLPVPPVDDFSPRDLSRCAAWFPLIGAALGASVGLVVFAFSHRSAPLAAVLGVLAWVWLTGALHLDGLADLADALGASHRDPRRFFPVLADPHVGTFGVVSVVLLLMVKVAALSMLSNATLFAMPLILAWARLGTLAWSRWLTPLKEGAGERFAWQIPVGWIVFWTALLLVSSALIAPALCLAPFVIAAWGAWLKVRLGGMTGDCLGAGVEITEAALLLVLALTSGAVPGLL